MKVIVIGGKGTIGRCIVKALSKKHEVITVGKTSGDFQANIADVNAIKTLFEQVGKVDAIVSAAGEARWKPFDTLTQEDFYIGLNSKLMGQVNLVKIGKEYLNPNGSITLTTGILADDPVNMTTSAAMVNGAIHSFVKAVNLELRGQVRVNAVAPGLVEDSAKKYGDLFPGYNIIPMDKVAAAYVRCVEGWDSGEVIRIFQ